MHKNKERHFRKNGGDMCKLIVRHIIKDACEFFSRELLPFDFEQAMEINITVWPRTYLKNNAMAVYRLRDVALETGMV